MVLVWAMLSPRGTMTGAGVEDWNDQQAFCMKVHVHLVFRCPAFILRARFFSVMPRPRLGWYNR